MSPVPAFGLLRGDARARALRALRSDDEAAVLRGYDEIRSIYGEALALEVWSEACRELDLEAEEDAQVQRERELLETLADLELVLGGARRLKLENRRYWTVLGADSVAALERLLERKTK